MDHEKNIVISESRTILLYLADTYHGYISDDEKIRARQIQWLMFQMAGIGPMFGQANHFLHYASESIPYGIDHYTKESRRLMEVLNRRLAAVPYLGSTYSIADMATWPWIRKGISSEFIPLNQYPYVERWYTNILEREAVTNVLKSLAIAIDRTHPHTKVLV